MPFFIFINTLFVACQALFLFWMPSLSSAEILLASPVIALQATSSLFVLTSIALLMALWAARSRPGLYPVGSFRALAAATATNLCSVLATFVIVHHLSWFGTILALISVPIVVCGTAWLLVEILDCDWSLPGVLCTLAVHASVIMLMLACAEVGWHHFGLVGKQIGGLIGCMIGFALFFWPMRPISRLYQPVAQARIYRPRASSDPTLHLGSS
jgi:hypothetical protein